MNSHQFWNKVIYQVNVLNNIIYCSVFSSFVWVCVFWENLLLKLFLAPDSSTTTFFRFLSRAQSISTNELLIGTFYINWPLFYSLTKRRENQGKNNREFFMTTILFKKLKIVLKKYTKNFKISQKERGKNQRDEKKISLTFNKSIHNTFCKSQF